MKHRGLSVILIIAISRLACAAVYEAAGILMNATDKTPPSDNVHVMWDFEGGLEGWANASASGIDVEVFPRAGELRGRVRGPGPVLDSPLGVIQSLDSTVVVVRMRYAGAVTRGSFLFRRGPDSITLPPLQYQKGDPVWDSTADFWEVEFDINGDDNYHVYYVPLYAFRLPTPAVQDFVTQLRFNVAKNAANGQTFAIDYIRVMKEPTILQIEGCSRIPFEYRGPFPLPTPAYRQWVRHPDDLHQNFADHTDTAITRGVGDINLQYYGITYNCLRRGGERIYISGMHFGHAGGRIEVGGRPCRDVRYEVPEAVVSCVTPEGEGGIVNVTVTDGDMPQLRGTKAYLSYAIPAAAPRQPEVSNIQARAVDINWKTSMDHWDAMTVTGYWLEYTEAVKRPAVYVGRPYIPSEWTWAPWQGQQVVGNVTVTTIINLKPATVYKFRIAALTEDQTAHGWQELDMYGRRAPIAGYLRSDWSPESAITATLQYDFQFEQFTANSTLDHGPMDLRTSDGMLGVRRGGGHYGLIISGDTNLANCNASHSCCDNYGEVGPSFPLHFSCTMACATVARLRPPYFNQKAQRGTDKYPIPTPDPATGYFPDTAVNINTAGTAGLHTASSINGAGGAFGVGGQGSDANSGIHEAARPTPGPVLPYPATTYPNGIIIVDHAQLARPATGRCGRGLRLTASHARQSGSAWYGRQQQVREGFETEFTYQISNPSTHCKSMDDAFTHCRSRGGDGFAFVIQNSHPAALGEGGMGLGYAGMANALAVEFDTYMNHELLDPGENHIAVVVRSYRTGEPASSSHNYELGHSVENVPDLTDGIFRIRITYEPTFDEDMVFEHSFAAANSYVGQFFTNGDFPAGGMGEWGIGAGVLKVFVDGELMPSLSVMLNLDQALQLSDGRAWVGFTGATGEDTYQTHDIHDWWFIASRTDIVGPRAKYPSPEVNGQGRHECTGTPGLKCIHPR